MAKFDEEGRQIPDSTRVAVPLRFQGHAARGDHLKSLIRQALERERPSHIESFEEADDFDVDDDVDGLPFSAHEITPMQEEVSLEELKAREKLRKQEERARVHLSRHHPDDDIDEDDDHGRPEERADKSQRFRDRNDPEGLTYSRERRSAKDEPRSERGKRDGNRRYSSSSESRSRSFKREGK